MKSNVEIMGRYAPKDKKWVILHFQYEDDKIPDGIGCGNCVVSRSYEEKLRENLDKLSVGYDKEKQHQFLYVRKG